MWIPAFEKSFVCKHNDRSLSNELVIRSDAPDRERIQSARGLRRTGSGQLLPRFEYLNLRSKFFRCMMPDRTETAVVERRAIERVDIPSDDRNEHRIRGDRLKAGSNRPLSRNV